MEDLGPLGGTASRGPEQMPNPSKGRHALRSPNDLQQLLGICPREQGAKRVEIGFVVLHLIWDRCEVHQGLFGRCDKEALRPAPHSCRNTIQGALGGGMDVDDKASQMAPT